MNSISGPAEEVTQPVTERFTRERAELEPMVGGAQLTGSSAAEGGDEAVNYEEAALVELELGGTDYRMDAGRAGTALCISTRESGTWAWVFRGEARWQNNVLRCKAFDREVLTQLSRALAEAATDSQS
jgi:hypothetical protein